MLSASTLCPATNRHLWRDGCKQIFRTLNLIDRLRPPLPGSGNWMGVGLAPGYSDVMKRLWMLLDFTAQRLVEINGKMMEEQTGVALGAAAHFEARAYLFFELSLAMLGYQYPGGSYRKIRHAFIHAITGRQPLDPPPEGPLARLQEREQLYMIPEGKQISKERILSFAELLTTCGIENKPAAIEPAAVFKRWHTETDAKASVSCTHLALTMGFRLSVWELFKDTPNIETLTVPEIDRRFDRGHQQAEKYSSTG